MSGSTEEEKMANTRKFFKDHPPKTVWYHSVLDPKAKVIYNDKGEIFIRDKQMWKDFVSNTWVDPKVVRKRAKNTKTN